MGYRITITKRAEALIDKLVKYLLFKLKNKQAGFHLLNGIEKYMTDWKIIRCKF